jgi:hypothetical protein
MLMSNVQIYIVYTECCCCLDIDLASCHLLLSIFILDYALVNKQPWDNCCITEVPTAEPKDRLLQENDEANMNMSCALHLFEKMTQTH